MSFLQRVLKILECKRIKMSGFFVIMKYEVRKIRLYA